MAGHLCTIDSTGLCNYYFLLKGSIMGNMSIVCTHVIIFLLLSMTGVQAGLLGSSSRISVIRDSLPENAIENSPEVMDRR